MGSLMVGDHMGTMSKKLELAAPAEAHVPMRLLATYLLGIGCIL